MFGPSGCDQLCWEDIEIADQCWFYWGPGHDEILTWTSRWPLIIDHLLMMAQGYLIMVKIRIIDIANDRNSDGDVVDKSPKGMVGVGQVALSVEPPLLWKFHFLRQLLTLEPPLHGMEMAVRNPEDGEEDIPWRSPSFEVQAVFCYWTPLKSLK